MNQGKASCSDGSMVGLPFKHKEFLVIVLKWKFAMLPKSFLQGSQVHNQVMGVRNYLVIDNEPYH